jgi:hypothetical protein
VRDGKKVTTHGPFAETKEQLGGFYLIDCENLDEAIEWAPGLPGLPVEKPSIVCGNSNPTPSNPGCSKPSSMPMDPPRR